MSGEKQSNTFDPFNLLLCTPDKKSHINSTKSPNCKENSPYPCFLYQSPSSLEQYIESFSRSKIKITKEIQFDCKSHILSERLTNIVEPQILTSEKKTFKFESTNMLQKRQREESICLKSPERKDIETQSTLFSTCKKLRRARKTKPQIDILLEYVNLYGTDWSKEIVKEISKRSNMKQSVVYKWIWDLKNKN